MTFATWDESGQPENLEAAALDALEWLLVLRQFPPEGMKRAVQSFQKLINEHEALIQNPTEKYPEFHQWDIRRQ